MRRTVLLLASAALTVLLISAIASSPSTGVLTTANQPNFVFILTDDMRKDNLKYMPKTRALLGTPGLQFDNAFLSNPLCCPSRATIMRGQYAHNTGVFGNTPGPNGGWQGYKTHGNEQDNIATRLHDAGYRTGLFGKYFNDYDGTAVPPGWDDWFGIISGSGVFDYYVNDNGTKKFFDHSESDYSTDVLNRETQSFIDASVGMGKPFFAYVAPKPPHEPAIPAPRDQHTFDGEKAPRLPSFNEGDVSDKPPAIRSLPLLSQSQIAQIDALHEKRVESLQSVDDLVEAVVNKLQSDGVLDNTYIVFTSDNGYHHGEHRIQSGKAKPYEESIRAPLLVRGPGVQAGTNTDKLTLNTDFFPTFTDLAGVATPEYVDGRSLRPILDGNATSWRTAILLEIHTTTLGIRTSDGRKYIEYGDGFKELYDLKTDPYELNNSYNANSAPADLATRLRALRSCAGGDCRTAEGDDTTTPPPDPPPETSITSGPPEGSSTTSNSVTFGFSSNEQGSTFKCQLNKDGAVAQAWTDCTSPKSYSNLSQGNYRFDVQATDPAGNDDPTPASRNWTITSPSGDTGAPTVISTVPTANATGVAPSANLSATFSEDMMASSINGTTFKLFKKGSTTKIGASVSYDAATKKATLNPTNNLRLGTTYKAVVSTGAKDLAGNPLDQQPTTAGSQQKAWTFTVSN
jgi:N-acetylglucosamine-6-sulfatase